MIEGTDMNQIEKVARPELIDELALAIDQFLTHQIERDTLACDLTQDELTELATGLSAIAAMPVQDEPQWQGIEDDSFLYESVSEALQEVISELQAMERNWTGRATVDHRIAAYQRGKLEGARLALEAAATVAPSKTPSGECETVGQWTRRTLREAIRALDPAKIVGEG